jgi:hypothetical protein
MGAVVLLEQQRPTLEVRADDQQWGDSALADGGAVSFDGGGTGPGVVGGACWPEAMCWQVSRSSIWPR